MKFNLNHKFNFMKRLPALPPIVPNTPIPPRSRACCFADSPRRGEYGALGRRLRRGQQFDIDEISCKQMNAISLARVSAYSFNDEIAASLGRVACLD
jgi:hypothetical protein